jgi:iron only hydrogenase large subunit-like protein
VELILKKYPSLSSNIINLLPPFILSAKMAREEARAISKLPNEDIGVFYISPCTAKVQAIKNGFYSGIKEINGALSVAETFKKLSLISREDVIRTDDVKASNMGIAWCTNGGQAAGIPNISQLAVDGIENVINVLRELEDGKLTDIDFAELHACHCGCVGGVLNVTNTFVAKSKIHTLRKTALHNKTNSTDKFDKPLRFYSLPFKWQTQDVFSLDSDINKALDKMSKIEEIIKHLPQLDCGVCGSPTCRAFAEDVVKGNVTADKCVRYCTIDNDKKTD